MEEGLRGSLRRVCIADQRRSFLSKNNSTASRNPSFVAGHRSLSSGFLEPKMICTLVGRVELAVDGNACRLHFASRRRRKASCWLRPVRCPFRRCWRTFFFLLLSVAARTDGLRKFAFEEENAMVRVRCQPPYL